MHRPILIAAFVLLAASLPLSAQHGGGHASAGGHSGFSGGHSGFSAGHSGFGGGHSGTVHAFTPPRSSSSFGARSYSRGFSGPLSSRGFNRPFSHSGVGVRIRTYGSRNCYGYPCRWGYGYGYPYLGGGVDPYWWWDSGSSGPDPDQQYQTGLANEMNQQSLEQQQMRRDQAQRDQEQQGDRDLYARSAPPHQQERTDAAPDTVLVFRDQHTQEVQNYAIVGQTVWIFSPQHTQKVPLSDLDLAATAKANDDRGVDFHVPAPHEGQ